MRPSLRIDAGAYLGLSCYLLLLPLKWVAAVVTAAAIHELGHWAAIRLTKGTVYEIRIGLLGAKIETDCMQDKQMLFCALAGPAAGAAAGIVLHWIPELSVCALVQTVFNLLPFSPFDGGRALRAAIGLWKDKAVAKSDSSVYNKPN